MIGRRTAVVATGVIRTPCGPSRALPFSPYEEYVVIILFAKGGTWEHRIGPCGADG